ncbi:ACT domain-containing protein [Rhizobium leguminosarum]|uniref:ACT domain-containing protein n=1 Tax=Rhizobium leguminosarum TaxID=384 RepID=UPI00396584AA
MRQITLNVNSALDDVGLTAGVAASLAEAGIPCNMVAAYHHDHVFVPSGLADRALNLLVALQGASALAMRKY